MKMLINLFICILFFTTCQSSVQEGHLFTQPKEWPIADSVSKKLKQKIDNGDVEYFSINEAKFRFQKSPHANNMYDIDVNQNNKWFTNLSLPMPKETFFLTKDFDLDNNFDLFFFEYGHINLYFFNKTKKCFTSEPMQFSYDFALLDSNRLIYGTNNHSSSDWDIDIFTIKDRKKIVLYKAKLSLKDNLTNGGFEITDALLYKCKNGNEKDTVLMDKIIINRQFSDFSLLQFMKDMAHNKAYR